MCLFHVLNAKKAFKQSVHKLGGDKNDRISYGTLQFVTDKAKESISTSVSSFRIEKNNAAPTVKGGYWKDIVILGPEDKEPPWDVKTKAKEVYLQYLKKEKLRLEKNGFQIEEILEIIHSIESQTILIKHETEHAMQRYGSPSKNRMLADILSIELDTKNKIQFLVRDVSKSI